MIPKWLITDRIDEFYSLIFNDLLKYIIEKSGEFTRVKLI